MSLISKSVLQQLPENIYSVGKSVKLWILTYAGEGQLISTTSVKLNLNRVLAETPCYRCRSQQRFCLFFPYSGEVEGVLRKFYHIPLWKGLHPTGSDNPLAFPKEEERDDGGAVLWRSILTSQAIIYGFINPEIITWADPEHKFNISTVCIQSVSMQNIQEQLLLTVSVENFLDPSNREKLNLLSKERGIQEIM